MDKLSSDSIISAYLHMLGKTQSDLNQPEYSEIYLRLAFKEACGKNFTICSENLVLYRKLLVLYYCEKYPSLTSAITIMERCFNTEDIFNIVGEQNHLLNQWWKFKNNHIQTCDKAEKRKMCSLEEIEMLNKKSKF